MTFLPRAGQNTLGECGGWPENVEKWKSWWEQRRTALRWHEPPKVRWRGTPWLSEHEAPPPAPRSGPHTHTHISVAPGVSGHPRRLSLWVFKQWASAIEKIQNWLVVACLIRQDYWKYLRFISKMTNKKIFKVENWFLRGKLSNISIHMPKNKLPA